jgi:Co/Zn/Cd efflux system component
MSYGYIRAEILGALASILLIWGLLVWLLVEAVQRLIDQDKVDGEIMLITALVGLACNFINIFTLHSCGCDSKKKEEVEEEEVSPIDEKLPNEEMNIVRTISHIH